MNINMNVLAKADNKLLIPDNLVPPSSAKTVVNTTLQYESSYARTDEAKQG